MDGLAEQQRSENTRRIRGKVSLLEMVVRSFVHGMGFRYKLRVTNLPGGPIWCFQSAKHFVNHPTQPQLSRTPNFRRIVIIGHQFVKAD